MEINDAIPLFDRLFKFRFDGYDILVRNNPESEYNKVMNEYKQWMACKDMNWMRYFECVFNF